MRIFVVLASAVVATSMLGGSAEAAASSPDDYGWLAAGAMANSATLGEAQAASPDETSVSSQDGVVAIAPEDHGARELSTSTWSKGEPPLAIQSASPLTGWALMDFGPRGVVRWRLVDRVPVTALSEPSDQSAVHVGAVDLGEGIRGDLLSVATEAGIEEFVQIPEAARESTSGIAYEFDLPPHANLAEDESGASVITDDGLTLMTVHAPLSESDSGTTVANAVAVNEVSSTVVVEPDPTSDVLAGTLTVDPIFQASGGGAGYFFKRWCNGPTGCAPTANAVNDLQLYTNSLFTLWDDTWIGWGVSVPGGYNHGGGALGQTWYSSVTAMGSTYVDSITANLYVRTPNTEFYCTAFMDGGGNSPWYGQNQSFYWNSNPVALGQYAGFQLNNLGGWVYPYTNDNRCSTETPSNYVALHLYDAVSPSVGSPGAPPDWINATYSYSPYYSAVDNESGVRRRALTVNAAVPQPYSDVCTPNNSALRPCSTSQQYSLGPIASSWFVPGRNEVKTWAQDFTYREGVSAPALVYFDSQAPLAPGIAAYEDTNGTATVSWVTADPGWVFGRPQDQNTGSGPTSHAYCISAVQATCQTYTPGANWTSVANSSPGATVSGLPLATPDGPRTYWIGVVSWDRSGYRSSIGTTSFVATPVVPAPTNLQVQQLVGDQVRASWTAVPPSTQQPLDHYVVCASRTAARCTVGADESDPFGDINEEAASTSLDLELGAGTWFVRVQAVDIFGNRGTMSAQQTITLDVTAPLVSIDTTPISLRAAQDVVIGTTATDSSSIASGSLWADRVGSSTQLSFAMSTPTLGTLTTAQLASASDGEYRIGASATDAGFNRGTFGWRSMCLDKASLLQPRRVVHVYSATPTPSTTLTWNLPSSTTGIAGYIVQRRNGIAGTWTTIARLGKNITQFADASATAQSQYRVESVGQACTTVVKGNGTRSMTTYQAAVMSDSPVGYWRMDDTNTSLLADASGAARNGSYQGTPSFNVGGATATSPAVQIAGAQATVASQLALHPGDTFTVELWFKRAALGTDAQVLFDAGTGDIEVALANQRIYFQKGQTSVVFASTRTVEDSTWHHLAWSKSGTSNAAYLDGAPLAGTFTNQTIVAASSNPVISGNVENATARFDGAIDEVALYANALDATSIEQHYRSRAQFATYAAAVLDNVPSGYWRMDDNPATTVLDSSGAGRHGTYTAAPTGGVTGAVTASAAVQLNGSTQDGRIPYSAALHPASTFSVELWFKPVSPGTGTQVLYDAGVNDARLYLSNGLLYAGKGGATAAFTSQSAITGTNWRHLVWTRAGSVDAVYLDGSPLAGTYAAVPLTPASGATAIGSDVASSAPFNGSVDEVAVYPTAVSAVAVNQHFELASSPSASVSSPVRAPRIGIADHWSYQTESLGAGASLSVNLAGGNAVLSKPLGTASGRGFDTSPTLTWNSHDVQPRPGTPSGGVLGTGWTLGLAGLAPGDGITSFTGIALEPLQKVGTSLVLRDDDGTPLTFAQSTGGTYTSPAGAWLYVRNITTTAEAAPTWAPNATIAATRPDRVTYWYAGAGGTLPASDGRLLGISDRNGARILGVYECIATNPLSGDVVVVDTSGACASQTPPSGYDLGNRLAKVQDAEQRTLTLEYASEAPGTSSASRDGHLTALTDYAGIRYEVGYQGMSSNAAVEPTIAYVREAAGTSLERTTTFGRNLTDDDATRWMDESKLITAVTDPRGGVTKLQYAAPDEESLPRVRRVMDRVDSPTGVATEFSYSGVTSGTTSVRDEAGAITTYTWDTLGRVVVSRSATGVTTQRSYTSSNRVAAEHQLLRLDEPVVLTATAVKLLAETSIPAGTEVVVRSAANDGGTRYTETTDYVLTATSGTLTLSRTPASAIVSGQTVYVTYRYATTASTWDAGTGFNLTQRNPAPQTVDGAGIEITPTPGELAPATTTTLTNSAFSGKVADLATVTTPRGTATSDPDDFRTTYTYSGLRLASVTRPINAGSGDPGDLATASYAYYSDGTLKSETDPSGLVTGYSAYDTTGQAQLQHVPTLGAFDPVTTPVATVTLHNVWGGATCVDDKRESGDTVSSPVTVNACQHTATNKVFTTTAFDAIGRSTVTTSPWRSDKRRATSTTYDANGNSLTSLDSIGYTPGTTSPSSPDAATPGVATVPTYDALDREIAAQLPSNGNTRTQRTTYDAADHVTRTTEPQGVATETLNDYTTTNAYDADARVVRSVDGVGAVSCTYYDRLGRTTTTTTPNAVSRNGQCPATPNAVWDTKSVYDRAGNAIASTNQNDKTTKAYYDGEGNVIRSVDPTGAATVTTPSADGGQRVVSGPSRTVCLDATTCTSTGSVAPTTSTSVSYGSDGSQTVTAVGARRAAESAPAADHVTTTITTTSATGNRTEIDLPTTGSDIDRNRYSVTDTLGRTTVATLTTDATSAAAAATGEKVENTQFAPDGSVLAQTNHATGVTEALDWNVNGTLASKTVGGSTTTYDYYPDGSLQASHKPATTTTWQPNRAYAVGQCVTPVNSPTTYVVYVAGVSGSSTPDWQEGAEASSPNTGSVSLLRASCDLVTRYTYDHNGALEHKTLTASVGLAETTVKRRDGVGRTLEVDDNGVVTTFTYDVAGHELTKIHKGVQTTSTWGVSATDAGLLIDRGLGLPGHTPHIKATFGYDDSQRLTSINRNADSGPVRTDRIYDVGGNLSRQVTCLPTTPTGACLSGNTLLSTDIYQDASYLYDVDGHVRVADDYLRVADLIAFTPNTAYKVGAIVRPSTPNGHKYVVTVAGTATAEPAWPTAAGVSVQTGTVTFQESATKADSQFLTGSAYGFGDVVRPVGSKRQYEVVTAGSAGNEPTWPTTPGATVTTGSVTFRERTQTTRYAYDGQGRITLEDRPDDPNPAVEDFDRTFNYNANGQLKEVQNEDCATGTSVAERFTYGGAAGEALQLDYKDSFAVTNTAGSCSNVATSHDEVTYSAASTDEQGSIAQVAHDPAGPAVPEITQLDHDKNGIAAITTTDDATTAIENAAGHIASSVVHEGSLGIDSNTYAGGSESQTKTTGTGATKWDLRDPSGWLVGEYSLNGPSTFYVSDINGTPVMAIEKSAEVIAVQRVDTRAGTVQVSGQFPNDEILPGMGVLAGSGGGTVVHDDGWIPDLNVGANVAGALNKTQWQLDRELEADTQWRLARAAEDAQWAAVAVGESAPVQEGAEGFVDPGVVGETGEACADYAPWGAGAAAGAGAATGAAAGAGAGEGGSGETDAPLWGDVRLEGAPGREYTWGLRHAFETHEYKKECKDRNGKSVFAKGTTQPSLSNTLKACYNRRNWFDINAAHSKIVVECQMSRWTGFRDDCGPVTKCVRIVLKSIQQKWYLVTAYPSLCGAKLGVNDSALGA